ncbi:MAG: hypothetical protein C0599_17870 [Salinivirgaceae bacterium]|nr:MAG: hypothetical protein C0599_17870 [Salinivirgaceae bacterium]
MSIERQFSRSIKQIERMPQKALYRQTKLITKRFDMLLTPKKGGAKGSMGKKVAREILWFFASILIGFLLGFIFYSIIAHFYYDFLVKASHVMGSVINFYYFLFIVAFVGIYVVRAVNWAIKLTLQK